MPCSIIHHSICLIRYSPKLIKLNIMNVFGLISMEGIFSFKVFVYKYVISSFFQNVNLCKQLHDLQSKITELSEKQVSQLLFLFLTTNFLPLFRDHADDIDFVLATNFWPSRVAANILTLVAQVTDCIHLGWCQSTHLLGSVFENFSNWWLRFYFIVLASHPCTRVCKGNSANCRP